MLKHILVTGCSFAYGKELDNRDDRYAMLIAKKLNCSLHDVTRSGSCNHLINDYSFEKLNQLIFDEKIDPQEILVIHSLSFINRLPVYWKSRDKFVIVKEQNFFVYKNPEFLKKHPGILFDYQCKDSINIFDLEMYYDLVNDDRFLIYNYLRDIMFAEMYYRCLNVKVVFTETVKYKNSSLINIKPKVSDLVGGYKKISNITFKANINFNNFMSDTLLNICKSKNYPRGKDGHPLEQSHSDFANKLLNFIDKTYRS